ncbi:MAG: hypothetical protein JW787_11725 [Sedimentisphaerales bacterium]|nr:hypothetical protein [Sedimentisphaerales bacterium]
MAPETENKNNEFGKIASGKRPSIVSEFWYFLKHNKKWWLLPILIMLLLLGLIVLLGSSALAPFIYPLF